ncbi:collagen alpha-1(XII) chain-like isoform X1 [Rana temporaria]|uniref:collagen alpha-1(XII) chain-like isoform X1 n=1 Tax=Rana temporaria TaxID=8407 RepID=UPI001AACDB1E|nr:collagen alpha-1(XII) chain-like isoform X1 [Rana temporaria]
MFVYLGLYLHILLSTALGHTIPEADHTSFIPDLEGDLLFLLDSSGSVTYDEFSNVKEFIGDLLRPFKYGPQDVQASVMQISTDPTLEFPLNQYTSSQDVQKAIRNIQQRMGDTNTGKALDYVKKQLYTEKFGSRVDVPKVMVWVTDGLSTDDISQPMQLLKDMGVTVFIVCTTGRGNFEELSAAASQPDEKHLKFVDKDDLGIITKELRDSIIELIQAKRLHALDITTTSFRLIWPRLLSRDTGHYVLEYSPLAYPRQKMQETLPGNQTSLVLNKLIPNTTYQVTLYPESNVDYASPQSIQVSTLHEFTEERKLEADDVTTTGFRLTWSRLSGDTGSYVLEYSVVSDPKTRLQKTLFGDETRVVLSNLLPNTTYQVTLKPGSTDKSVQLETIYVTTLPDLIRSRNLQVLNVTMSSFNVTWSKLLGDTGRYFLDYAPASDPRRKLRKTLYGDQTNVVVSNLIPKTTYQITFSPESSLSYIQSQTLQVTTLPDLNKARNLKVLNVTSTGFLLTWLALPGDTLNYTVNYVPISKPGVISQMFLHRETSAVIRDLSPNTAYEVTFIPLSNVQFSQSQTLQVFTLPDPVQERNLQVKDITSTSFLLTWARMPLDSGSYTVQYALASDPRQMLRKTLTGDDRVVIDGLTPDNTYRVTLIPESNAPNIQDVTIQVSTLPDLILARNLQIKDKKSTSFQLTWSRLSGDTGNYVIEYAPVTDLGKKVQKTLYGYLTSVVFSNLAPSTTYEVTFIPESRESTTQSQTIQVTTLPGLVQTRNLQAVDITATSLRLVWSRLPGDPELYVLEYSPISDPRLTQRKIVYGTEIGAVVGGLLSNTTYRIALFPHSAQHVQPDVIMVSTKIDPVQERNLQVKDITSTSFLITWSRMPFDSGSYTVQYALASDPRKMRRKTLTGDDRVLIDGLTPDNTYRVTLIPESNAPNIQDVTIQVSTLPDLILARNLHIKDKTSTSFQLTWSRLSGDTGNYVIEYAPVTDLGKKVQKTLYGYLTSVVFSNLAPSTTYEVTFIPESRESTTQSQTIQVTTLPGLIQKRNLHAWDISTSSFRLTWSRLTTDRGRYVLEYALVSDPQKKLRKMLTADETTVLISNLNPDTKYQATLHSEANVQYVPPQSIQIATLPEQLGPAQILISDPTAHSFRVSWGPHLDSVIGYEVQYGPLPSNSVQKVHVDGRFNTTIIEGLKSNTTYLVTVSAIFKSGGEKALSAIACTEINGTKVKYLHIEDLRSNSLKAVWGSADGNVQGYQIRCRRQAGSSSTISVAPETHSVQLTGLSEGTPTKICVRPVYKNGAGRNLCKKVKMHPGTAANSYSSLQTPLNGKKAVAQ